MIFYPFKLVVAITIIIFTIFMTTLLALTIVGIAIIPFLWYYSFKLSSGLLFDFDNEEN